MPEINSIGLIELSSVATGFVVEDLMLKAGSVQLLLARRYKSDLLNFLHR